MYDILLLLIFHYIGFFIFKPKSNILSCGIFGWAGGNVKDFNKDRLNILGLKNQSRGEDSCGIATNGEAFIGIGKTKSFDDFLKDRYHDEDVYTPKQVKSVIGHTRNASVGSVNIENAHPFGFGNHKGMFAFMGIHNGTIYNKEKIAEQFEIRPSRKIGKTERHLKIDSEILLEAIYKSANLEVLSMYRGAAAIAFVNIKTPNKLYLFRGRSIKFNTIQDERPLYVYKESKTSMYFSSLRNSLFLIGGSSDTVEEIEDNIVYEITNGDFDNAVVFKIDRDKSSQNTYSPTNYSSKKSKKNYRQHSCNFSRDNYSHVPGGMGYSGIQDELDLMHGYENIGNFDEQEEDLDDTYNSSNYTTTTVPKKTGSGCLDVENNLRYYSKDKKLAEGIYYFLPGQGITFLSVKVDEAISKLKNLQGKYYYDNSYSSIITDTKYENEAFIPISNKNNVKDMLLYFFNGCLLKEERDYHATLFINKKTPISVLGLSEASVNPIMELDKDTNIRHTLYINGGEKFDGKVIPFGGTKTFYVNKGTLKRIRTRKLVSDLAATHRVKKLKAVEVYVTPKKISKLNKEKLEKFNIMAIEIGGVVLEKAIININTLSEELKEVKEHKLAKKIKDGLAKCEDILYGIYDNIEAVK